MNITIISVGKLKKKYFRQAEEEYSKRISKHCKLRCVEVADEKAPENLSEVEIDRIKEKEAKKILNYIEGNHYLVALVIRGRELTTEILKTNIKKIACEESRDIVFVIGGSLGLSETIIKRANLKLSFSKMTFPHQLMKIILMEQLSRLCRE
ncbi:MAG: 23S rRNA (pseudouridine(1915)-N(3))-methyltransferase RlmH [Alkaliphilus sp.]